MTSPEGGGPGGAVVPAFSIGVPGDWIILDLELTEDPDLVQEIVDRRVAQGILEEESRDAAVALVTRVAHEATERGVRFAAVLIVQEAAGPTVASFTAMTALLASPKPVGDVAASEDGPSLGESEGASSTTTLTEEEVSLPAGQALRIERVVAYPLNDGIDQEVYAVQYVIPVGPDGAAIVLGGVSPAIRRQEDLARLFQEIAETLRVE